MKHLHGFAIVISSLLCVGVAYAAPYTVNRVSDASTPGKGQTNYDQPHVGTPATPQASVSYSGTTVGGSRWARTYEDCIGTSSNGSIAYQAQPITVSASGSYTISSIQAGSFDGYLFLYAGTFDPAVPNTNCIIGNDDGSGGVGTSEFTTNLTAGSTYIVVTTGYGSGDAGTFTNTIDGPGTTSLLAADLVSITKTAPSGVVTGGTFTYSLMAQTVSSTPAAGVVVTDMLPASLTYVSNSCGATVTGSTVTWNLATLAGSSSRTCTVTVRNPSAICATISNSATITTTDPEYSLANNTSAISNAGANIVADPSFESGTPNTGWTEASTNAAGTPVCNTSTCNYGDPHTGNAWVGFGGGSTPVTSSMSQSLVIPSGSSTITFWAQFPVCSGGPGAIGKTINGTSPDFVRLTIDGTEVWRGDDSSPICFNSFYTQFSFPLAGFANGAAHNVRFESTTSGGGCKGPCNIFLIDDVAIAGPPVCTVAPPTPPQIVMPVPAIGLLGLLALMASLIGFAWIGVRKQA